MQIQYKYDINTIPIQYKYKHKYRYKYNIKTLCFLLFALVCARFLLFALFCVLNVLEPKTKRKQIKEITRQIIQNK